MGNENHHHLCFIPRAEMINIMNKPQAEVTQPACLSGGERKNISEFKVN